jgi:hypothetical protein
MLHEKKVKDAELGISHHLKRVRSNRPTKGTFFVLLFYIVTVTFSSFHRLFYPVLFFHVCP